MIIHNCHTHIFTFQAVPEGFLPLGLVRLLAKRKISRPIARWLNHLNPFSNDDLFDRYAAFLDIGTSSTQEDVFNGLQKFYPPDTRFVVLSMDLEHIDVGKSLQPFTKQLQELAQLKQKYQEYCLPFIFIDPRRDGIVDLGIEYLEKHDFTGLKIYPTYGYYPYDSRLEQIYSYAEEKQIPIIPHTAAVGVFYRGKWQQLKKYLQQCKFADIDVLQTVKKFIRQKRRKGLRRQKICSFFAHPVQYLYLLNKYPKLKISLGHFGGNQDWDDYIQNPPSLEERKRYDKIVSEIRSLLNNDSPTEEEQAQLKEKIETAFGLNWLYLILQILKEYENVYTDISFTINDKKYFPLLKNLLQDTQLREKILFGSDYYMAQIVAFEKHFSEDIGKYLGEDDYRQIAETNPKAFLAQSR